MQGIENLATLNQEQKRGHHISFSNDNILQLIKKKLQTKSQRNNITTKQNGNMKQYYQQNNQYTKYTAENQENFTMDSKEMFLMDWEKRLIKQQQSLDTQRKELKSYSKQLEIQSNNILHDKLEINTKLKQYCLVLEQINQKNTSLGVSDKSAYNPTIQNRKISRPSFNNSPMHQNYLSNSKMSSNNRLQNSAINSCQNRISSLLKSIQKTSKSTIKTRPSKSKGYFQSEKEDRQNLDRSEIEECLFGGQKSLHVNSYNQTFQKEKNYYSESHLNKEIPKDNPEKDTTEYENEMHELKLNSIQMNEQLFYRKIQMEVDKLKDLKKKML